MINMNPETKPRKVEPKIPLKKRFLNELGIRIDVDQSDTAPILRVYQKGMKVRILDQRDMKVKGGVHQPDIDAEIVNQRRMDVGTGSQPRSKDMQLGVCPDTVFQPRTNSISVHQGFMSVDKLIQYGIHVGGLYQPGMDVGELDQRWADVKYLNQQGMDAGIVNQYGASIGKLKTGRMPEISLETVSNYGKWDLREAEIDEWEGNWVYFDEVKGEGATLPDRLENVIETQEYMVNLANYCQEYLM